MKSIQFLDIETVQIAEAPEPAIEQAEDAIVKVELAGLCGSDLHLFHGRETGADIGTIMGHEFVGTVVSTGSAVRHFTAGDRVFAPFTTSCGNCFYCERGLTSRCEQGELFGWRSGQHGLHGGQAEHVRVPLADGTLLKQSEQVSNELALLLGDNLSTGFYCADLAEIKSGETCAVIGCGTVGLLAIVAAKEMGAENVVAVDLLPERLQKAEELGATHICSVDQAEETIKSITGNRGADSVLEVVGLPQAQQLAFALLRPGGTMSVIGCHCSENFAFSPIDAYDKSIVYKAGRCPARYYMERLSCALPQNIEQLERLITHRFSIDEGVEAYDVFANRKNGCQKAVIDFR